MTIQMEGDDDDDLKLQRASASAITEIKHGIARVAAGIGIDDINASSSSRADFNVTIKRIIVLVSDASISYHRYPWLTLSLAGKSISRGSTTFRSSSQRYASTTSYVLCQTYPKKILLPSARISC